MKTAPCWVVDFACKINSLHLRTTSGWPKVPFRKSGENHFFDTLHCSFWGGQTVDKAIFFHSDARKMNLQAPKLAKATYCMGPKVSKGRSESPLVAPAGAKPSMLASAQCVTCKNNEANYSVSNLRRPSARRRFFAGNAPTLQKCKLRHGNVRQFDGTPAAPAVQWDHPKAQRRKGRLWHYWRFIM